MRNILILFRKELLQISRNKAMLPLLTIVPVVQLFLLSFAASHEIKNIKLSVIDQDRSTYSSLLVSKLGASGYFVVRENRYGPGNEYTALEGNEADIVLSIPANFEKTFYRDGKTDLQLLVNAINGVKGALGSAYLSQVIFDFNSMIQLDQPSASQRISSPVEIVPTHWYNPTLNF